MRLLLICGFALVIGFISGSYVAAPLFSSIYIPTVILPSNTSTSVACVTSDFKECSKSVNIKHVIELPQGTTTEISSFQANFNEEIKIMIGNEVILTDGLKVVLIAINDSRCKPDVQCIWSGELSPQLKLSFDSFGSSTTVSLGTLINTKVMYGQYTFSLGTTSVEAATITITKKITTARENLVQDIKTVITPKPVTQATIATSESNFGQEVIDLIEAATTKFRTEQSLKAFKNDPDLAASAKKYSSVLLEEDYLTHNDKSSCDLTCRFTVSKYAAQSWGENLARMTFEERPAPEYVANFFMTEWLKSAGHRKNVLSPVFTNQGIGVSVDADSIYVTVHFALPK